MPAVPVVSATERLKQEDLEFKDSLGCIVRSCLKHPKEEGKKYKKKKSKQQ
jgi:hypothetical protein